MGGPPPDRDESWTWNLHTHPSSRIQHRALGSPSNRRPRPLGRRRTSATQATSSPSRGDVEPMTPAPVAAVTATVNAIDKSDVRRWLRRLALDGDLAILRAMHAANPSTLHAWGKGTSLGFTGNSAMHWAAAKGHVDVIRWLLSQGASPDARNNADSTPSHSAAGAGQKEALRALLLEGAPTRRFATDSTRRRETSLSGDAPATANPSSPPSSTCARGRRSSRTNRTTRGGR